MRQVKREDEPAIYYTVLFAHLHNIILSYQPYILCGSAGQQSEKISLILVSSGVMRPCPALNAASNHGLPNTFRVLNVHMDAVPHSMSGLADNLSMRGFLSEDTYFAALLKNDSTSGSAMLPLWSADRDASGLLMVCLYQNSSCPHTN